MARHEVEAEVAGTVLRIAADIGAVVAADDPILLVECMKMEIPVPAPAAGRVARIEVAPGDPVAEGQVVAVIEG